MWLAILLKLSSLWYREVWRALDTIIPECSILARGAWRAFWFKEDLQATKCCVVQLECCWRKSIPRKIEMDLDHGFDRQVLDSSSTSSDSALWDEFLLVLPKEVDRTVGEVGPSTSRLNPFPSWLIKETRGGLCQQLSSIVNASLREGILLPLPQKRQSSSRCWKKKSRS